MTIVRAFAPANISCVFKIYPHKNPRWMGSFGVGFTVNEGVVASVEKSDTTEIFFNNKKIDFPTVASVIHILTKEKVRISIATKLPLGCGFGISGASTIATTYALNKLYRLKKTKKQLAIIAHTAEVKNKTGLGDVTNQFFGGVILKKKPSSHFSVIKISLSEKAVYCRVFSPLSTKNVLNNRKLLVDVDKAAKVALEAIENELSEKNVLTLAKVLSISKEFTRVSGLLQHKDVIHTIEKIEKKGGSATMIMLGNAILSNTPIPGATKLIISSKKAHLL